MSPWIILLVTIATASADTYGNRFFENGKNVVDSMAETIEGKLSELNDGLGEKVIQGMDMVDETMQGKGASVPPEAFDKIGEGVKELFDVDEDAAKQAEEAIEALAAETDEVSAEDGVPASLDLFENVKNAFEDQGLPAVPESKEELLEDVKEIIDKKALRKAERAAARKADKEAAKMEAIAAKEEEKEAAVADKKAERAAFKVLSKAGAKDERKAQKKAEKEEAKEAAKMEAIAAKEEAKEAAKMEAIAAKEEAKEAAKADKKAERKARANDERKALAGLG